MIFGLLSFGLQIKIEERARALLPDRVQNSITQLVLAQYRHISREGIYAGTTAELVTDGDLPIWADETPARYTMAFPGGELEITYRAETIAQAGRIAARLGAIAALDDEEVRVGFAQPLDLALMNTFLPLDGTREMTGDLNLGNSSILNAATITATSVDTTTLNAPTINVRNNGAGRINADTVDALNAEFDNILITRTP